MNFAVSYGRDYYGILDACGRVDGTIELKSNKKTQELYFHTEPVSALSFGFTLEKKAILGSVSYDGYFLLWMPVDGKWSIISKFGLKQQILSVSISDKGQAAIALRDGTVVIYSEEDQQYTEKRRISSKHVTAVSYFPDTNDLAYATADGRIGFDKEHKEIQITKQKIVSLATCDFGIACITEDSNILSYTDELTIQIPSKQNHKPQCCTFTPITNQLRIIFENSLDEIWSYHGDGNWTKN